MFRQFLDEYAGNPDFETFDPGEPAERVDTLLHEHMNRTVIRNWQKCGVW